MSISKMTFSLASLIFLIAFGLVFAPTSVMAHTDADRDVDNDGRYVTYTGDDADIGTHTHPVTTVITGTSPDTGPPAVPGRLGVPLHNDHPTVSSLKLKNGNNVSVDTNTVAVDSDTNTTFTLVLTFNGPVVGLNNITKAIADANIPNRYANGDLGGNELSSATLNVDRSTAQAATSIVITRPGTGDSTSKTSFEIVVTPGAYPSGTAGANDKELMFRISVSQDAVFSFQTSELPEDAVTAVTVPGGGNSTSDLYVFKLVNKLPDVTPPVATLTPPTEANADGTLSFKIKFDDVLGSGANDLSRGDFEIMGGTATDTDLTHNDKNDKDKEWTLKVTPASGAVVKVTLRADSVADVNGIFAASKSATYDKVAPTITIKSAAGTGDDAGKVVFTIDSNEALGTTGGNNLTLADLSVSNAAPLKVADLVKSASTGLPTGVKEQHKLTVTPTDATKPNVLDLAAGSVADANGNMVDGMRHTYTPSTTTPTTPTPGTPPTATQIGSKAYAVFVPADHDASALPSGLAPTEVADMPNLADFFRTGGTIDVVVKGKTNHQVIITEIMVAEDLGKRGGSGMNRPAASQWIELYNNTAAHINISDISFTFTTGYPAPAAPANATDRFSNTVAPGWGFAATFKAALSGETAVNTSGTRSVTGTFTSLRRKYKNDKQLQDAGTVIQDGSNSGSWALTDSSRLFLAGRAGTPGSENRPTVFDPAKYEAPTMTVKFNEIANRSDDTNEWIELEVDADYNADYNLKLHKISIVTGYDKVANTGTETAIFNFPDADVKIPAGDLLLLTDQDPAENELAADLENGVPKPVRYRIETLAALPNDGDFLLVLRNKDNAILDVAGYLAGLDDDDPYTLMWPLKAKVGAAKPGHISAKNELVGGNVYKRARDIQGYLSNKDNGDEPAFEPAGFTGIGYDRLVNAGNKEHHGTPGYPNGAQIGDGTGATDNVIISEIMYGDASGNLPQWIELHNRSDTNGVDLHNWRLYIINHSQNADGSAFAGKILDEAWLRNVKIPPNQTALVVAHAGRHTTVLPSHRILNLRRDKPLLSSKGFSLRLEAKSNEGDAAKRQAGDMAGNLAEADTKNRRADHQAFMEPAWALPAGIDEGGARVSIARRGSPKVKATGTDAFAWLSSADDTRKYNAVPYYGRPSDVGTPGHTSGGVLPVSLSKFRPELLDDGSIVIRWITESELNNAGFNILRSEKRDGEFTKINTSLIAGQGTTSERTTYSLVDKSAKPNVVYYYQIQDVSLDGQVQTLRQSRLKGDISPAGKLTTIWGEIKALQ